MKPLSKNIRTRLALLLAASLLAVGGVASAQAPTEPNLQDALQRLTRFKQEVASMRTIAQRPLGPYVLQTDCTVCVSRPWYMFGMCETERRETWKQPVDYTWTRNQLTAILNRAAQEADSFSANYAPTQRWIDSLPAFSAIFDTSANRIAEVQVAIGQGGATDAQRAAVVDSLQKLSSQLAQSVSMLNAGSVALTTSLQQQSAYRQQIPAAIATADQSARDALRQVRNVEATHQCHDDDAFNRITADFNSSLSSIQGAFVQLDAASADAERGIASLLGAVVNSQTELNTSLNLVNAASNDQLGSFLSRLHLSAAKQMWSQLAAVQVAAR